MPQFGYAQENVCLGFITGQSEEELEVDVGADPSTTSFDIPELRGIDIPTLSRKIKLPLYNVITIPKRETLRACLPVFPMGCSPGYSDTFGYRKGDLVLIQFTGTIGYPLIMGAVPIFAKDKVRSNVITTDTGRSIVVGSSVVEIAPGAVLIRCSDFSLRIAPDQITLSIPYSTLFTATEAGFDLGPINYDSNVLSIQSNFRVDAHSSEIRAIDHTESSNTSNLSSSSRTETLTTLTRNVDSQEELIRDLKQIIGMLSVKLADFAETGNIPKATIEIGSTLDEKGGITIQKEEGAKPEKVAKAKTLKEQLDLLVKWAKTHIHKTSGSPPDVPPLDFTEEWFSDLVETD